MIINKKNYEIWFVDFLEGNLQPEEKEALYKFLEVNPDKKQELDQLSEHYIKDIDAVFENKNDLKKSTNDLGQVSSYNIDEYSIAYMENDLTDNGNKIFRAAISENIEFKKTYELYQATKILPDGNLIYKHKGQLKHFIIGKKLIRRTIAIATAAASILVAFWSVPLLEKNYQNIEIITMVDKKEDNVTKEATADKTEIIGTAIQNEVNTNEIRLKKDDEEIGEEKPVIKKEVPIESGLTEKPNQERIEIELPKINPIQADPIRHLASNYDTAPSELQIELNKIESTNNLTKKNSNNANERKTDQKRIFDFWKLAELALRGFNLLNETEYEVAPNYNNSGEVNSVTLITNGRVINAPAM